MGLSGASHGPVSGQSGVSQVVGWLEAFLWCFGWLLVVGEWLGGLCIDPFHHHDGMESNVTKEDTRTNKSSRDPSV